MSYKIIRELLQCPDCGGDLTQGVDELTCDQNRTHSYPIVNGIVRFVSPEVGSDYNIHWTEFSLNPISQTKVEQASNFVNWLLKHQDLTVGPSKVFLDLGCGDGNHISFLPEDAIKIAIDYSSSVNLVANRYPKTKNLFIMQAYMERFLPRRS